MSGVPSGFGHVAHAPKIHRSTGSGGFPAIAIIGAALPQAEDA